MRIDKPDDDKMIAVSFSKLQLIQDSIAVMQSTVPPGHPKQATHVVKLELERSAFNLNQLIAGKPVNTKSSTALRSVFSNVDLLEKIFGKLSNADLRLATQACSATYRLFKESIRIRETMCLEPDHASSEYLLLPSFWWSKNSSQGKERY